MSKCSFGKSECVLICLLLTAIAGPSVGQPDANDNSLFEQQARLSNPDGAITRLADYQEITVSVDGNTAVVGASGDEISRGSAYVYLALRVMLRSRGFIYGIHLNILAAYL